MAFALYITTCYCWICGTEYPDILLEFIVLGVLLMSFPSVSYISCFVQEAAPEKLFSVKSLASSCRICLLSAWESEEDVGGSMMVRGGLEGSIGGGGGGGLSNRGISCASGDVGRE
jgi:hypothetical protein